MLQRRDKQHIYREEEQNTYLSYDNKLKQTMKITNTEPIIHFYIVPWLQNEEDKLIA